MTPHKQQSSEETSESELIERWVADSCEHAARELMERFHPRVASIIRQRHRQPEDWPDLEQETFTRVFRNLHRYRPEKPLEHWISRIALNVCRETWRKRSSRKDLRWSDLSEAEQQVFDRCNAVDESEADLETRDAHSLLLKLMEQLDPTDRLILSLLYQDGYRAPEVAEQVGLSKAAVRVRAHRARRKLAKQFRNLLKKGTGAHFAQTLPGEHHCP
ncbi:MAG: sigma-70 family RNA polymerase sigma factor [Verrucomicrobiota bacterium]